VQGGSAKRVWPWPSVANLKTWGKGRETTRGPLDLSDVVRSLNSFRKQGPYDTVVQHAQLRVKRTYSRIDTELGNRARQHRGSVKRAKALAWRALGVVNIAERSDRENGCFVITMEGLDQYTTASTPVMGLTVPCICGSHQPRGIIQTLQSSTLMGVGSIRGRSGNLRQACDSAGDQIRRNSIVSRNQSMCFTPLSMRILYQSALPIGLDV
jgi:hypothetical protein